MAAKASILRRFRQWWLDARKTSTYRNVLLYLVFVGIAFLFWLILSLNNNMQDTITVKVRLYNVPDSVTFLTDPPSDFHLNVRDKGTSLLRNGALRPVTMNINFKEYAKNGVFRFTQNDLHSTLRNMFGNAAQLTSISLDSVVLDYTTAAGKSVPVQVVYDITTANGKTLAGVPTAEPSRIKVYSKSNLVDTLNTVFTTKLVRRQLSDTETVEVQLAPIKGVKMVPSTVKVKVDVDALVSKTVKVPVVVQGLPKGESAMIYPDKVDVSYFVPMKYFNEDNKVEAYIDYSAMSHAIGGKSAVHYAAPNYIINLTHNTDSVEFTLIR